jgi:hypothetical protein
MNIYSQYDVPRHLQKKCKKYIRHPTCDGHNQEICILDTLRKIVVNTYCVATEYTYIMWR